MARKKILLIEDLEEMGTIFEIAFKDVDICQKKSVKDALAHDWRKVDIVVLDWQLEDGCGKDILQHLLDEAYSHIKVIIFTAYPKEYLRLTEEEEARVAGIYRKPEFSGLVDAVLRATKR